MSFDLNDIANLIAITALIPIGLFIFYYGSEPIPGSKLRRYSRRWKSTTIGRVLMTQKIMWFGFLTFVLFGIFTEPYAAEGVVRIIAYGGLVAQFWLVFFTLRHIQKMPPPSSHDNSVGVSDREYVLDEISYDHGISSDTKEEYNG